MSLVILLTLILVLVVAVVWGVGRIRHRSETGGGSAVLQQVIVFALLLGVSIITTIGVAGLLERLFGIGSTFVKSGAGDLARDLSFVIVGGPVTALLWAWTLGRLRGSEDERRSDIWGLFIGAASTVGLVMAASPAISLLSDLLGPDRVDIATNGSALIAWGGFWAWHWWVYRHPRTAPVQFPNLAILAGAALGLAGGAGGFGVALGSVLGDAYRSLTGTVIARGGTAVSEGLAAGVVGALVWVWHWWLRGRHLDQRGGWLVYTLLAGVLGGLVTVLIGVSTLLFSTLTWFFGRTADSAVVHFDVLPGATRAILIGGAVWAYHRSLVRDPERVFGTEAGRAYRYLQSGIGLVAGASGVGIVIAAVFQALAGPVAATGGGARETLLGGITALAVGGPLWGVTWRSIQQAAATDPATELRSIWRRVYLVLLFGVAGIVALITLLIIAFRLFEVILEGTSIAAFLDSSSTALGLLFATGAVAGYHLALWRSDRRSGVAPERRLHSVLLVAGPEAADLEQLIHAATGAKVVRWQGDGVREVPVADLPGTLAEIDERRVLVVTEGDRARIVPYRPA